MHTNIVFPAFALAALANGATHTVLVGKGGLVFSPNSFTAAKGDTVEFSFVEADHSVVQGSFSNPCQPSDSSAFYSGEIEKANQTFTITVDSTDPLYFYCAVPSHCQNGMVGAINAPSDASASDYAMAASNVQGSTSPAQAQGGILNAGSAGASSSTTSSAPSSSTASSSAAATQTSGPAMTGSTSSAASTSSATGSAPATQAAPSSSSATQPTPSSSSTPATGDADRLIGIGALALGLPVLAVAFAF